MKTEKEITKMGNPAHPEGEFGSAMLDRMNVSHEQVTNWGLDHFKLDNPGKLLDIGCGGGATLSRLKDRYENALICGLDYSEVSVEKSNQYNRRFVENGEMEIIRASVEDIPYDDYSFDGITTVESFYFWPSHVENLKEVRRVLKENGVFLLIADVYDNGLLKEQTLENIKEYNLFVPTEDKFMDIFSEAGFGSTEIFTKENTSWICIRAIR